MADQVGTDQRDVLGDPPRVSAEVIAQPRPLIQVRIAPQVHHLIERPDLGLPIAFELAVVVLANVPRHRAGGCHHVVERPVPRV
jgi:hypothetical protein